jgi:hypothetical protein
MNNEKVLGVARRFPTFADGVVVSRGLLDVAIITPVAAPSAGGAIGGVCVAVNAPGM